MSRSKISFKKTFAEDFVIALVFSVTGVVPFIANVKDPILTKILLSACFSLVSAGVFAFVLAAAQSWIIPRTKVPSFILTILLVALTYLAVLMIAIPISVSFMGMIATKTPPWSPESQRIVGVVVRPIVIVPAFFAMVGVTFYFMVSKKLGPGVLRNWFFGKYHRPRQEERIFMFLDLRDSTKLGEELGDLKFSRMIQRFFEDLSGPVLRSKGEVSHYIGDEAVLSWQIRHGLNRGNVLRCFFLMKEAIDEARSSYLSEFGHVPGFKAGAHIGSVVTTQVGDIKSEIVFHGDVLNTTSRIQGLCNELGSEFLVSAELQSKLIGVSGFNFDGKGSHPVKGKQSDVTVFSVSCVDQAALSDKSR